MPLTTPALNSYSAVFWVAIAEIVDVCSFSRLLALAMIITFYWCRFNIYSHCYYRFLPKLMLYALFYTTIPNRPKSSSTKPPVHIVLVKLGLQSTARDFSLSVNANSKSTIRRATLDISNQKTYL